MHERHSVTGLVTALAFLVAAEYAVIAVDIVPRLARLTRIERRVVLIARWGATAFFVGCAITHAFIGLQSLHPSLPVMMDMRSNGTDLAMALEMVLPHVAQVLGGGAFIWIARTRLEVIITSKEIAAETRQMDLQLRTTLDRAPIGIAFAMVASPGSDDGRYANIAYREILGFSPVGPLLAEDRTLRLVHPSDRDAVAAAFGRVDAGEAVDLEFRIVSADQTTRWVRARRSPPSGDSPQNATILEDITERVTARDRLLESEQRFVQLVNSVGVGISLRQLKPPKFLWANAAYIAITGNDPAQRTSSEVDPALMLLHPDDQHRVLTGYWAQAQAGQVVDAEFRVLRPDGRVRWVHAASSPVSETDGSVNRVAGTFQDITDRKTAEHVLAEERRRLREAETVGQLGSWDRDLITGVSAWSSGMLALHGMDPAGSDSADLTLGMYVHSDDRAALQLAMGACEVDGTPIRLRYRIFRQNDGALRWLDLRGQARYSSGRRVRIGGSVADITEQVTAEAAATADARALQLAIFSATPDVIVVWDYESESMTWANRSIGDELGYSAADIASMVGTFDANLVHPEDIDKFLESRAAAQQSCDDRVFHVDYRMLHKDGSIRWFSRRTAPLRRTINGRVTQVVGVIRDTTESMAAGLKVQHSALHDTLTGLPNRALLLDRIESAVARADRDDTEVCVLFCDLDGFKQINDAGGHAAGDAVLVAFGQLLRESVRKSDSIARVGGDEFVLILEPYQATRHGVPGPGQPVSAEDADPGEQTMSQVAELVANRIRTQLREPIIAAGQAYSVSVSIGMCLAGRGSTAEDVLRNADSAMYLAKKRGRNGFEIFDLAPRPEVFRHTIVENALRTALAPAAPDGARLGVAFQPVFELATGELAGFEALARLSQADGECIPPDRFIPVAESTGMICGLGAIVLDIGLAGLARWHTDHQRSPRATLAVNISARQTHQTDLVDLVFRALIKHRVDPTELILELTESILLEAGSSGIRQLTELRDAGVGIAIDDFGTGYASLRYLTTLPITSLKVDRSFTAGLPTDKISSSIVRSVAALAAELGLSCVVEGIETELQLNALPAGVLGQGYLLGRPTGQLTDVVDRIRCGIAVPTPAEIPIQAATRRVPVILDRG